MFDYKMKSQNETITTYEYKGTISKYHSSMDGPFDGPNDGPFCHTS